MTSIMISSESVGQQPAGNKKRVMSGLFRFFCAGALATILAACQPVTSGMQTDPQTTITSATPVTAVVPEPEPEAAQIPAPEAELAGDDSVEAAMPQNNLIDDDPQTIEESLAELAAEQPMVADEAVAPSVGETDQTITAPNVIVIESNVATEVSVPEELEVAEDLASIEPETVDEAESVDEAAAVYTLEAALATVDEIPDTLPELVAPNPLNPDSLVGLNLTDLGRQLGWPDFERSDADVMIWQYALDACITDFFLYLDGEDYVVTAWDWRAPVVGVELDSNECATELGLLVEGNI